MRGREIGDQAGRQRHEVAQRGTARRHSHATACAEPVAELLHGPDESRAARSCRSDLSLHHDRRAHRRLQRADSGKGLRHLRAQVGMVNAHSTCRCRSIQEIGTPMMTRCTMLSRPIWRCASLNSRQTLFHQGNHVLPAAWCECCRSFCIGLLWKIPKKRNSERGKHKGSRSTNRLGVASNQVSQYLLARTCVQVNPIENRDTNHPGKPDLDKPLC